MTHVWTRSLPAIALAGLAAVTIASAGDGGDTTPIRACVSRKGEIRVLSGRVQRSRSSACHRGETLVTWNIAGPQGPAGPAGSQGVPGARGETGAPGARGPAGPGFSGTQFYTVGNGDLRPASPGIFGITGGPFPGGTFATAAAPLWAGVHLPQGATLLGMTAHVYDNSGSNLIVELFEQSLSDGSPVVLSAAASDGAAGAPYAVTGAPPAGTPPTPVVDNEHFHYFVRVSPSPGWTTTMLQVLGVTVTYTLEP